MPMLGNDSRVHSTIGLSAIELQGIDNETVVLVVEEKLPKSDRSITYGLILDLAKLIMSMCLTLTEKGLLYFPEDRAQWTPKHIQEQWDQIEETALKVDHLLSLRLKLILSRPLRRREPQSGNPRWDLLERRW